jgi:hypothetical protein
MKPLEGGIGKVNMLGVAIPVSITLDYAPQTQRPQRNSTGMFLA